MKEKRWICRMRPVAVMMLLTVIVCCSRAQVVTVGIRLLPGIEFRMLPAIRSDSIDGTSSGNSLSAVRWIELAGDENMEILLSCRKPAGESSPWFMNEGSFNPDGATPLTAESRSFVLNTAVRRQKDLIWYKAWIGITDKDPGELTIVFP